MSLVWIMTAVAIVSGVICSLSGQELPHRNFPATITVNTSRPLAEVLNRVQQQLLSPIDFEEASYESAGDLRESAIVQNGRPAMLRNRPIIDFTTTFDPSDSTGYLAAQSALSASIHSGLPGSYKVVQQNSRVDVIPTQVRAADGSMRDVTPVMSHPVTFPVADRSVVDTVQLIAESVSSESGIKVLPLNLPFGILDRVELGANGEPAGDVIEHLGAKFGRTISYQCLYDATSKTYYLNLIGVAPASPPGGPPIHGIQRHPTRGPANSPFFVKQKQ